MLSPIHLFFRAAGGLCSKQAYLCAEASLFMKTKRSTSGLAAAAVFLLAARLPAQTSGVAHPEVIEDTVTTTTVTPQRAAKPSAAIPVESTVTTTITNSMRGGSQETASPQAGTSHYVPRSARDGSAEPVLHTHSGPPGVEDAATASLSPAKDIDRSLNVTEDVNSGIVTDAPSRPGELHSGSLLHARLETRLSTEDSRIGTPFLARLEQAVERQGEVLLPAGTLLTGRVADVHGGSRLRGGALLRLQPDSLSLPDGTVRRLSADLVDLGDTAAGNRVSGEGVITEKGHAVRDLTAAGLATGSGAVAGALIGGGIGAVVGASIGAGVSTVVWLRQDKQEVLPAGTMLVFSLSEPLSVRASAY